jgi:hypothetical protein
MPLWSEVTKVRLTGRQFFRKQSLGGKDQLAQVRSTLYGFSAPGRTEDVQCIKSKS